MRHFPGLFITFEGIEGTGKSTHAKHLFAFLKEKRYPVLFTVEPGGTEVGNQIRSILLHPQTGEVDAVTELFLFEASRREHVLQVIQPALQTEKIVLCVRFCDSTIAYQGYGRGLSVEMIQYLNSLATNGLVPDLTLLLDIDPEEGLRRSFHHTAPQELRFEEEFMKKKDVLDSIRRGFFKIAEGEPNRFQVISTVESKDVVFERIKNYVLAAIQDKKRRNVP